MVYYQNQYPKIYCYLHLCSLHFLFALLFLMCFLDKLLCIMQRFLFELWKQIR